MCGEGTGLETVIFQAEQAGSERLQEQLEGGFGRGETSQGSTEHARGCPP